MIVLTLCAQNSAETSVTFIYLFFSYLRKKEQQKEGTEVKDCI